MGRTVLAALFAALLCCSLTGLVWAQEKPAPEEKKPAPPEGHDPAKPRKSGVAAARKAISGEKVEITLRPGVIMSGVVQSARVEIMRGGRYFPISDTEVRGAGIRIFYAYGLNGFLFIPYESIRKIKFLGDLTEEEGLDLARRVEEEMRKAEEDQARAQAQLADMKAAARDKRDRENAKEGARSEEEVKLDRDRQLQIRELLVRFPPDKWKPARLDEIKRRAIVLDIYPNEEERAFIDNYDLWFEGFELWQRVNEATGKGGEPAGVKPAK